MPTIRHTIVRPTNEFDSDSGEYIEREIDIEVEGSFQKGECSNRRYPDEASIEAIYELLAVEGPRQYPSMFQGPLRLVRVEFNGDLTGREEEYIQELLVKQAREDIQEARVEAHANA